MALLGKVDTYIEIKSSAEKFHDVYTCRPHHVSVMSPEKIHGVDLHDGGWGQEGSVINWNYTHDGIKKTAKEIIEKVDGKNHSTTFKVIGGNLLEEYKNFKFILQVTPKGEGSLVHWTLEYEKINQETPDPNSLLELLVHCAKDIDAHLLQQPTK